MKLPENIVADRNEVSGKNYLSYLTDEQMDVCAQALTRATPPTQVEKVQVKDAKKWAEQQKRWFDDEGDMGSVLCLETILQALTLLEKE